MGRGRLGGYSSGSETRSRILDAGASLLRREGFAAVRPRSVAREAQISLSALQFHFATQDALEREVIAWWNRQTTQALEERCEGARGLARTWALCRAWIDVLDDGRLPLEVVHHSTANGGHDGRRATFLEAIDGWIELTRKSLHQAKANRELKADVDLRETAIELHRILWSHNWSSVLLGRSTSARMTLVAVHQRLEGIALDSSVSVPAIPPTATKEPEAATPAPRPPRRGPVPTWTFILKPGDPRYHAFERHEAMGDPRDFTFPPEVTDVDREEAEAFHRKHPAA